MGIEGIVLKHHGDIPLAGGHLVDPPVAHAQFAAADLLQSRDHAQGSGLAAAGGAQQNQPLAAGNDQVQVLDHLIFLIDLFHVIKHDGILFFHKKAPFRLSP